jgi:HSP20 family molecular chaperone IbpA
VRILGHHRKPKNIYVFPHAKQTVDQFERIVFLPVMVDAESARCIFDNGVLEVTIDKKRLDDPVEIAVQFN